MDSSYISFRTKKDGLVWTHSSLLEPSRYRAITEGREYAGKLSVIPFAFGLLATGYTFKHFQSLKSMKFGYKVALGAFVVLPIYQAIFASMMAYTLHYNENDLLDGVAYYKNKADVPRLDRAFFHLDDDQNFKPSLWHHGLTTPVRAENVYYKRDPKSQ